jgi:hypothetical protein
MIRFEFHGGFRDGQVISGNASLRGIGTETVLLYMLRTDGGRIGVRFDETPQNPADQTILRALLDSLDTKDPHAVERLRKLLVLDSLDATDPHAVGPLRKLLLLVDSLDAKGPHARERLRELLRLHSLEAKDLYATGRWQRLLRLDSLYATDPCGAERWKRLLRLDGLCADDPDAKTRLRELCRFFRQTYEVTKRDEGPDEIVIRVDFVEQHKPLTKIFAPRPTPWANATFRPTRCTASTPSARWKTSRWRAGRSTRSWCGPTAPSSWPRPR